MATLTRAHLEITDEVVDHIRDNLVLRHVTEGIKWWDSQQDGILSLDPLQRNAARLVGHLSQWVELSYSKLVLTKQLLSRFPKPVGAMLPLGEYVYLALANATIAFIDDEPEEGIRHLEFIISAANEAPLDKELLVLTYYWKARCHRRNGDPEVALADVTRARELAVDYPILAATVQECESVLQFEREKLSAAAEILAEAHEVLRKTDDAVSLGNIESLLGQLANYEGRYHQGMEHFVRALAWYRKIEAPPGHSARVLHSLARAKRLIALRFAKNLDAEVSHHANSTARGLAASKSVLSRRRCDELRAEAFSDLAQAEEMYRSLGDDLGLGAVRLTRGCVYLDMGDLECSAIEAEAASHIGIERKNHALMAVASIIKSKIDSARYEEGIDDGCDPKLYAQRAQDHAKDAITHAQYGKDRRMLASAYIRHGLTLCSNFFNNWEAAADCCMNAGEYLPPSCRDHAWEEFHGLKIKILRSGQSGATGRIWSQGITSDKTLRQLTEEFDQMIILQVWEREGRKISRVAKKLSISPKKVRRILGEMEL